MRLQGDVLLEVKAAKVTLEGIAALVIGEWLNLRCKVPTEIQACKSLIAHQPLASLILSRALRWTCLPVFHR